LLSTLVKVLRGCLRHESLSYEGVKPCDKLHKVCSRLGADTLDGKPDN